MHIRRRKPGLPRKSEARIAHSLTARRIVVKDRPVKRRTFGQQRKVTLGNVCDVKLNFLRRIVSVGYVFDDGEEPAVNDTCDATDPLLEYGYFGPRLAKRRHFYEGLRTGLLLGFRGGAQGFVR